MLLHQILRLRILWEFAHVKLVKGVRIPVREGPLGSALSLHFAKPSLELCFSWVDSLGSLNLIIAASEVIGGSLKHHRLPNNWIPSFLSS